MEATFDAVEVLVARLPGCEVRESEAVNFVFYMKQYRGRERSSRSQRRANKVGREVSPYNQRELVQQRSQ